MKKVRANLSGMVFGKLTVKEYSHSDKWGNACWICECECGNQAVVSTKDLKRGHTNSCGCYQKQRASEAKTKHGKSGEDNRLYRIWKGIKERCFNSNARYYSNYGGRGISICDEWRNEYLAFEAWALSHGYQDHLTIDRIDVNGNYEPDNCRWVSMKEQCNNRRNNNYISFNGKTQTAAQWADELGVERTSLVRKLRKESGEQCE